MELPELVRVKISSESAEWIALTRVVARDMPVRELIEMMLGLTGKNPKRLRELLLRGTLVNGASRFRWQGWEAEEEALARVLAEFPDPDPALSFAPGRCTHVVLRSSNSRIDLAREAAEARRAFHRRSFWQALMDFAATTSLRYSDYSYKEKADVFVAAVDAPAAAALREHAGELRYSSLENWLLRSVPEVVEFYVSRGPA